MKHGNNLDKSKKVHVAYGVEPERFDIRIMDEGPGFDPQEVPDPDRLGKPRAALRPRPHADAPLHERGLLSAPAVTPCS